jgi:hypothetical protein
MTATVRRLARNVAVDISADDVTYLNLPGRTDSNPDISPNSVDSSDFDNGGYASAEITQQSGTVTVSYNSLISGGTPNPAQEMVEACVGEFGDAARLYVRWYDTDGGTRGFKARAIVKVAYSSTGVTDLRKVTVTFTTDGEITKLAAADITAAIGNADKPVITAASQTGTGVGSLVTITGQHFTGTTAVKFGATAATSYTVVSDSTIVATAPATGASAITVTNGAGVSSGFNFTVAA